jgi:hypothetical protein
MAFGTGRIDPQFAKVQGANLAFYTVGLPIALAARPSENPK